ncbi:unnamed protein product [Allacma fusca]|uniref:Uncharacterized protein n=3 Tax=Allacma fusca TaxID=39272 RepID=A0A8J2P8Y8_9HEXA|nr:unnamed protein product [Allacma fusca]
MRTSSVLLTVAALCCYCAAGPANKTIVKQTFTLGSALQMALGSENIDGLLETKIDLTEDQKKPVRVGWTLPLTSVSVAEGLTEPTTISSTVYSTRTESFPVFKSPPPWSKWTLLGSNTTKSLHSRRKQRMELFPLSSLSTLFQTQV